MDELHFNRKGLSEVSSSWHSGGRREHDIGDTESQLELAAKGNLTATSTIEEPRVLEEELRYPDFPPPTHIVRSRASG